MSAFVASGTAGGGSINFGTFWPSIDLDALRASLRIDSSVTPQRLKTAVINAAISVHSELKPWRVAKETAGYTRLAEVPSEIIEDESAQVHLHRRAIEAATGAEICERYRDYSATNTGNNKADEITPTIDDYRRDLRWAVRDFLGVSRTTVELI